MNNYEDAHRTYDGKCISCGKELIYSIVEDKYEFCNCAEKTPPKAKDQVSIADQFENELEGLINKYSNQGVTVGTLSGALQNRIFNMYLNIHLPSIIEVVKRHLK